LHILDQITRPVIFAHRGSSANAPENTIAAFDLAFQQKSHAIELDTMLSADGIPVVIHDRAVNRTTNGEGLIDYLSVEQLKKFDAGSWFSDDFTGERIPLLKDVLKRYGKKHLINIELKNFHAMNDNLPSIVTELIEDLKIEDNILISSFIPCNLRAIRKKHTEIRLALLCSSGLIGKFSQSKIMFPISPQYIHTNFRTVSKKIINMNHDHNRRVHAWTVDDVDLALNLTQIGIDGIITNNPGKMFELLHSN
jgi:glycerophosphoryl diester phosphodiesterase